MICCQLALFHWTDGPVREQTTQLWTSFLEAFMQSTQASSTSAPRPSTTTKEAPDAAA